MGRQTGANPIYPDGTGACTAAMQIFVLINIYDPLRTGDHMSGQPHWTAPEHARMRRALLPHMEHVSPQAPNAGYGARHMLDAELALCAKNQFVAPTFRSLQNHGVQTMTPQRFLQILGRTTPDQMLETGGDILEASVSTRSRPLLVYAQYVADLACLTLEKIGDVNACIGQAGGGQRQAQAVYEKVVYDL